MIEEFNRKKKELDDKYEREVLEGEEAQKWIPGTKAEPPKIDSKSKF
jgi:hypothetical protein